MPPPADTPALIELQGLWRRSEIRYPDGRSDTTSDVHWLQGLQTFVDLRQPAGWPSFAGRCGRDSLSVDDCATLARQQGFAGRFAFDGSHFEWQRRIDFQPKTGHADAGSLTWEQGVLVERGRDVAYTEHWHRDGARSVAPAAAIWLRDTGSGANAVLLRVGADFMMARDRAVALTPGATLAECVTGAASSERARELIDCEISRGLVAAPGLQITQSTLPYRAGDVVNGEIRGSRFLSRDRAWDGGQYTREWEIIAAEGEIEAVLRA
jgi:hypothetical protein